MAIRCTVKDEPKEQRMDAWPSLPLGFHPITVASSHPLHTATYSKDGRKQRQARVRGLIKKGPILGWIKSADHSKHVSKTNTVDS